MTDILIVEDNKELSGLLCDFLRAENYTVSMAESGEKALSIYEKYGARLVLLDIMLPGMDGFETTKIIRSLDNTKKAGIPIVAMTANAFDEDRKKALENGMNGHISKPFNVDTFAETVLGYIGERMNSSKTE